MRPRTVPYLNERPSYSHAKIRTYFHVISSHVNNRDPVMQMGGVKIVIKTNLHYLYKYLTEVYKDEGNVTVLNIISGINYLMAV